MELDSTTARRRLATVAAHFPLATKDPVSTASLVPLNCSGSLNSVIRRCDNKLSFARQASSEQGFFMKQASPDETGTGGGITLKNSVVRRCDNRLYFARQASSAQGLFMRQASTDEDAASTKYSATKTNCFPSSQQPLLSRPEYAPPQFSKAAAKDEFFVCSDSPYHQKEDGLEKPYNPDLPKLANLGTVWSPRSNVAEYENNYLVAVELPGGSINDIRVEVGNTNLTVTGRRTFVCQKVDTCPKGSVFGYQKQEILQGPFKVFWPLPSKVNKDNVAAEFMDGILGVGIPKI
uniref:Peroxisomal small heat shock protein ACD31.2 n=1 Tax=Brassica campestris TaxID=3711 RepID=A8IXM7_BRACM|nr:peroxisomal small heat shock protein ACD31.2 [Brassica rapa]